jgi:hypothetical protein
MTAFYFCESRLSSLPPKHNACHYLSFRPFTSGFPTKTSYPLNEGGPKYTREIEITTVFEEKEGHLYSLK